MTNKLLTVFKAARDYLSNPEKWLKGGYGLVTEEDGTTYKTSLIRNVLGDYDGPCCLLGALHKHGLSDLDLPKHNEDYVQRLMNPCLPERFQVDPEYPLPPSIPNFNDAADTTHADVLKVMDCTIARLEQP